MLVNLGPDLASLKLLQTKNIYFFLGFDISQQQRVLEKGRCFEILGISSERIVRLANINERHQIFLHGYAGSKIQSVQIPDSRHVT